MSKPEALASPVPVGALASREALGSPEGTRALGDAEPGSAEMAGIAHGQAAIAAETSQNVRLLKLMFSPLAALARPRAADPDLRTCKVFYRTAPAVPSPARQRNSGFVTPHTTRYTHPE